MADYSKKPNMKYRITEFKVPASDGSKFFVETGTIYSEKYWAFIYIKKISWTVVQGFETMELALLKVDEIKKAQPIYHEIR